MGKKIKDKLILFLIIQILQESIEIKLSIKKFNINFLNNSITIDNWLKNIKIDLFNENNFNIEIVILLYKQSSINTLKYLD